MNRILAVFLFLLPILAMAQPQDDARLASYYMSQGEPEKAVGHYEKAFKQSPIRKNYDGLISCYLELKEYDKASKLTKKRIKAVPHDMYYRVRLGSILEAGGDTQEAEDEWADAIKSLDANQSQVLSLYNGFKGIGRNDLALAALEQGRRQLKDDYPLHFQFAEVYADMGKIREMISEYVSIIQVNPRYEPTVKAYLTRRLDLEDPKHVDALNQELIKASQANPDITAYNELLIWLYNQTGKFGAALIQAKAIDKRNDTRGARVYSLGEAWLRDRELKYAQRAFAHVIKEEKDSPFHAVAMTKYQEISYLQITRGEIRDSVEMQEVVNSIRSTIDKVRDVRSKVDLLLNMTDIMAFYQDDVPSAITELENGLAMPGVTPRDRARLKMKLGDVYVLTGDIWEAALLYGQIDKDFKEDPLGHEARFKNARVFYYDGEFQWAQSQLDVLKASTSKLIANDALSLSLFILDNLGMDSTIRPMKMFAAAELKIEQHQFDQAFAIFDSIDTEYPFHKLSDDILMKKAKAEMYRANFYAAAEYLKMVVTSHGNDLWADDALYELGRLYEEKLDDREQAADYYKQILFKHKGSLLTVDARKRFRALTEDLTEEEKFKKGL